MAAHGSLLAVAVRSLIDEGVIGHAGLSEVTVEEIEAARKVFPVATVQNQYNLVDRRHEEVLDYCERENIGFIPWFCSPRVIWRSRAEFSMPSPPRARPHRARLRWHGRSSAAR